SQSRAEKIQGPVANPSSCGLKSALRALTQQSRQADTKGEGQGGTACSASHAPSTIRSGDSAGPPQTGPVRTSGSIGLSLPCNAPGLDRCGRFDKHSSAGAASF